MDLNIGTALWFAASGKGYVREYSGRDVNSAMGLRKDGRPLLRLGGAGAAAGVGLAGGVIGDSNTSKKGNRDLHKGVGEAVLGDMEIEGDGENQAGDSECAVGELGGDLKKNGKPQCTRDNCKMISKRNCPYTLCKKCCIKRLQAGMGLDSHQRSEILGLNKVVVCTVHTSKLTSKTNWAIKSSDQNDRSLLASDQCEEGEIDVADAVRNGINQAKKDPYTSPVRAVLIGAGADEQLAGYSRHRTCYRNGGKEALLAELQMDCARIWTRNLGRDDRCIADRGREAWYPYLDEQVVNFLQSLPFESIADLTRPQGEGDKMILREVARMLGLRTCTTLVKRAIQFGSRIAQITNTEQFGSHRRGKGTSKIKLEGEDV